MSVSETADLFGISHTASRLGFLLEPNNKDKMSNEQQLYSLLPRGHRRMDRLGGAEQRSISEQTTQETFRLMVMQTKKTM